MNKTFLIGDTDPFRLYREIVQKPFDYRNLLNNESVLVNLYGHNIKDGARLIRTPTLFSTRSFLKNQGLEEQVETCLNLAISKAKEAIRKSLKDVLIAGVIGPTLNDLNNLKDNDLKLDELSETIIMMDSFGVDCFILQNFTELGLLKSCLNLVAKLSNLPIAVFYPAKSLKNEPALAEFNELAIMFDLELVGISGGLEDLEIFKGLSQKMAYGLMLQAKTLADFEAFDDLSLLKPLTMLLADQDVPRKVWQKLIYKINQIC